MFVSLKKSSYIRVGNSVIFILFSKKNNILLFFSLLNNRCNVVGIFSVFNYKVALTSRNQMFKSKMKYAKCLKNREK